MTIRHDEGRDASGVGMALQRAAAGVFVIAHSQRHSDEGVAAYCEMYITGLFASVLARATAQLCRRTP